MIYLQTCSSFKFEMLSPLISWCCNLTVLSRHKLFCWAGKRTRFYLVLSPQTAGILPTSYQKPNFQLQIVPMSRQQKKKFSAHYTAWKRPDLTYPSFAQTYKANMSFWHLGWKFWRLLDRDAVKTESVVMATLQAKSKTTQRWWSCNKKWTP